MKNFAKLLIVLLVALTVVFAVSYKYAQGDKKDTQSLSTSSQETSTTQAKKTVLLEDSDDDYRFSSDGTNAYLYFNGYEKAFPDWLSKITEELPEVYCKDYDDDGEKELMIKLFNQYNSEFDINLYDLVFVKLAQDADGNKDFIVVSNSESTWKTPFADKIICEMTQLKTTNKIIQFVLENVGTSVSYDDKTGISTNEHVAFARAPLGSNGEYYTLSSWTKGEAIYSIDEDGTPTVDIQVLAYYEEMKEAQLIGYIHCDVRYNNNELVITPGTISFQAQSGFEVCDPRDTASSTWSAVITNTSSAVTMDDNTIDWINNRFEVSELQGEQTSNFSTLSSKIKLVESVEFTESEIILTARSGCSFSQGIAKSDSFSVSINDGEKAEANIADTCSVETIDGNSTLIIKLDKTYDKEDLKTVTVKFGA